MNIMGKRNGVFRIGLGFGSGRVRSFGFKCVQVPVSHGSGKVISGTGHVNVGLGRVYSGLGHNQVVPYFRCRVWIGSFGWRHFGYQKPRARAICELWLFTQIVSRECIAHVSLLA